MFQFVRVCVFERGQERDREQAHTRADINGNFIKETPNRRPALSPKKRWTILQPWFIGDLNPDGH